MLDEEDPNVQALEVGLLASRWIARRKLTVELETVDTETIEGLLADTTVALERSTSIRRCHTTARKQIDQARVELDAPGLGSGRCPSVPPQGVAAVIRASGLCRRASHAAVSLAHPPRCGHRGR